VGRAGRGIDRAEVVLLRGAEDRRIQDFFISQAFPPRDRVERVLERIGEGGATVGDLMGEVNLGRGRIDAMLKVLDVEGAVAREGSRWVLEPGGAWSYDAERYERITALRRREQAAMAAFGADGRCLMRALREELDDPAAADCGICSVCAGPRFAGALDPALVREAALLLRSRPLVLEVKKMAPDATGAMKKLPDDVRAEEGRALARLGDGGWDPVVQAGLREGRFPDELVQAAADIVRAWAIPADWVAAVPSRRGGAAADLVSDFARRLAGALGKPFEPLLERAEDRPPQREMANSAQQVANVRGAFRVVADAPPGACLLVDDVRFSGWTLAMVAGQLRRRGSGSVHPLALATAF
jgi:ATP-dependent DNA helicase RecQ